MNTQQRIDYASKRIDELRLLIKHWKEHEREKQVREERAMP